MVLAVAGRHAGSAPLRARAAALCAGSEGSCCALHVCCAPMLLLPFMATAQPSATAQCIATAPPQPPTPPCFPALQASRWWATLTTKWSRRHTHLWRARCCATSAAARRCCRRCCWTPAQVRGGLAGEFLSEQLVGCRPAAGHTPGLGAWDGKLAVSAFNLLCECTCCLPTVHEGPQRSEPFPAPAASPTCFPATPHPPQVACVPPGSTRC